MNRFLILTDSDGDRTIVSVSDIQAVAVTPEGHSNIWLRHLTTPVVVVDEVVEIYNKLALIRDV